jgi:outer membrane receptor for ferrienterochelin and colicins
MKKINLYCLTVLFTICFSVGLFSQAVIKGIVKSANEVIPSALILLKNTDYKTQADSDGKYELNTIPLGNYELVIMASGYNPFVQKISVVRNQELLIDVDMVSFQKEMDEVVISGTMKEVSKLDSPVPVEVYSEKFFKANPNPSIFEALQHINGVRPQINCNVCNTGDIHINGLEGPYTMVLIDGMPIVSGLSTVYGLSGIPQALIDRVEIVKGPASTLYGSEAVGGLINIITKNPNKAPIISLDIFGTSWGEMNADVAGKFSIGKKTQSLLGVNYFNYSNKIDNNKDGFTDVALQKRFSVFNKWNFERKQNRVFSLAGRYVYEDRWGGDMHWNTNFRGGDSIYGESVYTSRWEFFGVYQLPLKEKILFQFSANGHDQNSVYGTTRYIANQKVGFGQLTWHKTLHRNDLLVGATYRYTYYDDNTPATMVFDTINGGQNMSNHIHLPGFFVQDEITLTENNKLLVGLRYDYNSIHGSILTPRLNYKWNSKNRKNILRVSAGNGYRVANVFTEDHAALTGARKIEFLSDLKPETSWNGNINFVKHIYSKNGNSFGLDATVFYTYFTNKIIADYETDANKIIYDNLDGYAVSQGISVNMDFAFQFGLKGRIGGTLMDVYRVVNDVDERQLFTEKFTGVWNFAYTFKKIGLTIDYTGNVYSPMELPLLSDADPRSEYSPWWSIQNIQITKAFKHGIEVYGGVKNLLNWTPAKGLPFLLSRTNDPFDKNVQFDTDGQAMKTPNNPYGLTFDPSYVYGPNQGIRGFVGIRWIFN